MTVFVPLSGVGAHPTGRRGERENAAKKTDGMWCARWRAKYEAAVLHWTCALDCHVAALTNSQQCCGVLSGLIVRSRLPLCMLHYSLWLPAYRTCQLTAGLIPRVFLRMVTSMSLSVDPVHDTSRRVRWLPADFLWRCTSRWQWRTRDR